MPEIAMKDLERQLKANKPSRVYLIYGTEVYLKQQAIDLLKKRCIPEVLPEFNYQRLDGTREPITVLMDAVEQFPMMADRRCVLLEDFDIARAPESSISILIDTIKRVPDSCVLIIWQNDDVTTEKNARMKKVAETCKKYGSVMKCLPPRPSDTARMLCDSAERLGLRMAMPEAYYMMELCGADLTNLLSELEKLSAAVGRKPITREAIDTYCTRSVDADVYRISRCILEGRSDEAFKLTRRLLVQKNSPVSIFTIMTGSFIDLYRAKALARNSGTAAELAEVFPGDYKGRGFRAENAMRDQSKFGAHQLRRYIDLLFEAELKLKGGRSDKEICLEQLIARLCMVQREGKK
ncbi:MAG: DNA polymerase III subunit delta [Ruminococcaceae bacterium]|nr:DNA polymerase III subunit delta [Oscillospiraceae bacterium]